MQNESSTIIAFFSESWDAQRAIEDLKFAGFEGDIRYVENDNISHPDDSKSKAGVTGFFAKLYGFNSEDEEVDSKGKWTVSPEAEEYFTDVYHRKNHVILVKGERDAKKEKAIEILNHHHGRIERQSFAFFNAVTADQDRPIEDGVHNIPPHYHPTTSIEPPVEPSSF
ncbi:MAG: hypothetical protein H7249_14835 [Chitinophagaceae bacterium]|nr:hypothetical protein [Oligoflexus sp.]